MMGVIDKGGGVQKGRKGGIMASQGDSSVSGGEGGREERNMNKQKYGEWPEVVTVTSVLPAFCYSRAVICMKKATRILGLFFFFLSHLLAHSQCTHCTDTQEGGREGCGCRKKERGGTE